MSDHQCPSCGGFCKKSGCERENVTPQSGLAEYNALVDRILKGTSYSHIDDLLASRDALVGEVEPVAWCLRYNDPQCGAIYSNPSMYKPELEAMECVTSERVSIESLFTPEAIAAAVLAERERAAKIVETYEPGGSYHIRTMLAAAIRGMK